MALRQKQDQLSLGILTLRELLGLAWRKPGEAEKIADKVAEVVAEVAQHNLTVGEGEDEIAEILAEVSSS
jgi:hypothetical protein